MRVKIGRDEWSPAFTRAAENASPGNRKKILAYIADDLKWTVRGNIQAERTYEGDPMKSPASVTKYGGRFSINYNWRYLKSVRHLTTEERNQYKATGRVGGGGGRQIIQGAGGAPKVRGRVPVTEASKQLQHTGATIKSIDILSVNPNKAIVGPTTGHGRAILSIHNPTRRPAGISKEFAERSADYAFRELMKGV